jgi:hypothetical protein
LIIQYLPDSKAWIISLLSIFKAIIKGGGTLEKRLHDVMIYWNDLGYHRSLAFDIS